MSNQTENSATRFVVGIDLGTTNSAVTYVDSLETAWQIRTLPVPQMVAPGQIESLETLPSFHYQTVPGELADDALRLPWSETNPDYAVGRFAREQGALVPGRLISSTKSWLSHAGVDRTAELLPWHAAAEVERFSPVDVAGRYLEHIHRAWDAARPEAPLAQQDIVLTLPASFDEVARELTVKAAARAGLPRILLIEEPQAAFYAWIYRHSDQWDKLVEPGQKILVCDCGGGTSDFTLIRVRRGKAGEVQFHRVAVGQHLILGGDNLDLALAHHLESRIAKGKKLESRRWGTLLRQCRRVKETLLANDAPESFSVNLPSAGSKLIGGGTQVDVTRDEVHEWLLDGFFPKTALDDRPNERQSGFQEFGLPYAPDAAVTRYLADFLTTHRHVALDPEEPEHQHDPARPDIILFNGGLFESDAIRDRLVETITDWFNSDGDYRPTVLDPDRLDLAVARGASYYGMVRRGEGVRIAAGLARTYYVGIESAEPTAKEAQQAICLVPAEAEPGSDILLEDRTFEVLVDNPVEFPLFVSSTRLTDHPSELIPIDREQMTPLPPIRTVLRKRKKTDPGRVTVRLETRLAEIGTLELWCVAVDGSGRWRLEFDVRSTTQTDMEAHQSAAESEGFLDETIWEECRSRLHATFGREGREKPSRLMKALSRTTAISRREWPTSFLRRIWAELIELQKGRKRSALHEARWLNLLGFALRPGYGLAADDWRVVESWRLLQSGLAHPTVNCRTEWWIFWRRIAAGLTAGQQQSLSEGVLGPLRGLHKQMTTGKGRGGEFGASSHETAELCRALGSFELLSATAKIELGDIFLDLYPKRKMEPVRSALLWTIGRLGTRHPMYGPLNTVVPTETAEAWLDRLIGIRDESAMVAFAAMQIARRTDDRYRDLPEKRRRRIVQWLGDLEAPDHYRRLIEEVGTLDEEEQGLVFGESLPKGLRIL